MGYYWIAIGIGVVFGALMPLLARRARNRRRRQTLRKLGLPTGASLTGLQLRAFRAFEDTEMRLKMSFPGIPDAQRELLVREVLDDRGLLPRRESTT